jgi:hypothetical protein
VCEQDIPNEKADQVRERIEARDRALSDSVSLKLKEQFALERVQIEANGRTALEQVKSENVAAIAAVREEALLKEAAAREEGSKSAQTAAQEKLDAMAKANATLQADATAKIAEIQQAKAAAEIVAQERIAAAERARVAAENLAKSAKENHETLMNERLQEQREALEKIKPPPCSRSRPRPSKNGRNFKAPSRIFSSSWRESALTCWAKEQNESCSRN